MLSSSQPSRWAPVIRPNTSKTLLRPVNIHHKCQSLFHAVGTNPEFSWIYQYFNFRPLLIKAMIIYSRNLQGGNTGLMSKMWSCGNFQITGENIKFDSRGKTFAKQTFRDIISQILNYTPFRFNIYLTDCTTDNLLFMTFELSINCVFLDLSIMSRVWRSSW
jgi:hypothetical protein